MVPEVGERAPLAPGGPLGVQPDQHHEEWDQRHRQPDDQAGHPVREQDAPGHHRRDDGRDQQGGQVAAEVALQTVESAGRERRDLAAARQVRPARSQPKHVVEQLAAQLADDVRGRPVRRGLATPGQERASEHHGEQRQQRHGERVQPGAAEEGGVDRPGQQLGLHHDQHAGGDTDRGGQPDEPPGRGRVPQQASVERLHLATPRATVRTARTCPQPRAARRTRPPRCAARTRACAAARRRSS